MKAPPAYTLLEVLRNVLNLTGTKDGCGKGECGACTVLINGKAVNACLMIMEQVEGSDVTTIEGLATDPLGSVVVRAFEKEGAIQCGYCTPGMIVSSTAFLSRNSKPNIEETKEFLRGNLCRCTGYSKIVKAVIEASRG